MEIVSDAVALRAMLKQMCENAWPDKTPEWRAVWLERRDWYREHRGDMTGAPEFPEGE